MTTKERETLRHIITVLSDNYGDTDPDFPEDFTDDDIRTEEPVFWVITKLVELIKSPAVRGKE